MLNQEWLKKLQNQTYVWQESVDIVLGVISSNIVSLFMLIGTVTIAIVPAIFTGFAVYSLTVDIWGYWLSFTAGVVFAFGLEAVGMTTSNVALHLYRSWRGGKGLLEEFVIASILMLVYVITVVLVILFVEELPLTLKAIGISSPFLAVILYVARGLYLDHKMAETKERIESEDLREEKRERRIQTGDARLAHTQRMERLKLEQSHEVRLIEAKAKNQIPVSEFSTGKTEKPKIPKINKKVNSYLKTLDNPELVKVADIARETGVAISTAWENKERFISQNGKS